MKLHIVLPGAFLLACVIASRFGAPAPPALAAAPLERTVRRGQYGGRGDQVHLGGFTALDREGLTPHLWEHLLANWTVRSVLDVGCGKGLSTLWFHLSGLRILCVEGSHDAVSQSLLPAEFVVEHDYSLGPWWPATTFDLCWSVEFVEHVGRQFSTNYLATMRRAALIIVTHSLWGGWHHVEVHKKEWWVRRMTLAGFVFDPDLTKEMRKKALEGKSVKSGSNVTFLGTHLWGRGLVFINPPVASLPEHAHLFGEPSCVSNRRIAPCDGADKLPGSYTSLLGNTRAWEKAVFDP